MTEAWVTASACLAPLAIFAVATILRIAAEGQVESPWTAHRRLLLLAIAYTFVGIGCFALLFAVIVTGPLGGALLIMITLALVQLIDVELKLAGKRRRTQQTEFLWFLATVVKNRGDLAGEIDEYAHGSWGLRHRRLIELAERLRNGTPLTEIAVPQGLLPRDTTLEIQAGLRAGRLYETLISTARRETRQMTEEASALRSQSALLYPATILTTVTLTVAFLLYYIVPKLKKIFEDFGTELPELTKLMISSADHLLGVWYLFLITAMLLVAAIAIVAFADYHGWRVVSRFLLGNWSPRVHTPTLLRSVSHAVAGGRPLNQAFHQLAAASTSWLLQRRAEAIHEAINEGLPCWQELKRQHFLRKGEVALLESAEQIGNLPWALNAIADSIERRWYYRMFASAQFLGPLVIVMLGMLVAFFAFAFFLPLIKLLNDLS